MNIELKYGEKNIQIPLKGSFDLLEINDPEYSIIEEDFKDELKKAIYKGNKKVAVVIADKTRLCDYPKYLPLLVEVLKDRGYNNTNITFYIAYGTHPKQTDNECKMSYGILYDQYKFVHHNCQEEDKMTQLGITSFGTPVKLRKDIIDSDLIITFGAISQHYFAGYGGGRKLLFPGLGEKYAIYKNHSLFLNKEKLTLVNSCKPGNLLNNPVAEDLKEIDTFLPDRISIHAILNSRGEACRFFIGKSYNDFLHVCKEYDKCFQVKKKDTYDIVLASCGGYPKDINFIQSHKSIHQAASFVKDRGTLLLFAECIDGMGNKTLLKLFQTGGKESLFKLLLKEYEGNGGTALAMMTKTGRIKIKLITSLDKKICDILNVKKTNISEVQKIISNTKGKFAVIFNASMIYK